LILARRVNDRHTRRTQKAMQFINVGALAGANIEMVQVDAILIERHRRIRVAGAQIATAVRPPTQ